MIKVDVVLTDDLLSQLKAQLSSFGGSNAGKIAPGTKRAFDTASRYIQRSWQNWARGGSIAGIENIRSPNTRLASSIKIRSNSDFDVNIETDSRYMERIQNGSPAYDMKTTYPYGKKSRVSKKGVPYLIIPFRWGTPNNKGGARAHFGNTIPLEVYKIISSRTFRRTIQTTETHVESNYSGQAIDRHEYTAENGSNEGWGDRIEADGNANGMVKMKSNTGSTYFTFRIISAKSPKDSWIRKEVAPVDVVGAVERTTRSTVEDLLQAGLEQDLGF